VELGKLDHVQDGLPLEYTVVKSKQPFAINNTNHIQAAVFPKMAAIQMEQQAFESFPIIHMPTKC
jgi:hypothetical protein